MNWNICWHLPYFNKRNNVRSIVSNVICCWSIIKLRVNSCISKLSVVNHLLCTCMTARPGVGNCLASRVFVRRSNIQIACNCITYRFKHKTELSHWVSWLWISDVIQIQYFSRLINCVPNVRNGLDHRVGCHLQIDDRSESNKSIDLLIEITMSIRKGCKHLACSLRVANVS